MSGIDSVPAEPASSVDAEPALPPGGIRCAICGERYGSFVRDPYTSRMVCNPDCRIHSLGGSKPREIPRPDMSGLPDPRGT